VSRKKWLAALACLGLAAGAYFLRLRRSNHAQPPGESDFGYVDPAVCGGCHAGIAKSYRLTGMGRSLYRPRPENRVEDFKIHNTLYHAASSRYYTMLERDGKLYQRRHQIGFDNQETNIVEEEIDFVAGSGNHARTYLHRTTEGRLVELPVSWYAEKGGYWAMSPGYDRADQEDFRRAIPYECMSCHNSYPEVGSNLSGGEPLFTGRIPEGIDCQRCHGPGRAHVAAAGAGHATPDAIRGAILNPSRLSRDRQLEVCMQCHLETTSRPLPNAIRRYDRAPFSYRPGEPLADYALYFDHGAGRDDKFEIAHAAYRLRKSPCFQASQMTCTTCHNPHQVPRGPEAAAHYAAACRSCHPSVLIHTPEMANCVECHMPKRRTEDAVHVVMTDHYIQRRKSSRDLLAPLREAEDKRAYRGEVALYYPPQLPRTPESELYLAVAQVEHGANLKSGIPRLQQAIEKYTPDQPEFYFELAKAYSKAGNEDEAIRWYDETLRRRPDFRLALKGLGLSLYAAGHLTRAADVLEKVAAAPPPDAAILTNLGNVYLQQGKLERAAQVLQQALQVNPGVPEAHNLLGMVSMKKDDRSSAEKHFRNAIRFQPDLAAAHNNLANLLAGIPDYAQARYHFEKAIASNPSYAEAHHNYGFLLVLMKSYDKALIELQEAVRLNPELAPAHSDLADVLAAKGRIESAINEYRRAIGLNPQLPEADFGLGRMLAAQGKTAEAEQQFRLAIRWNPNYHEAHLALGLALARKGNMVEARAHYQKAAESGDPAVRQVALNALR
jgi:tetratricopeptide (TPR) repeat protein